MPDAGSATASGKTFAIIGVGGYIAPRHMEAIAKTGGRLKAAFDPADSVGIIDRHAPQARFFTEFERFAEYIEKLKRQGEPVDYITVCSPNYLHKAHAGFGLRTGTEVICEKPLVLDPADIDALAATQRETNRKLSTILQLRLHPSIIELRDRIAADRSGRIFDAELTYVTSRGLWYYESWKGKDDKSGGIATNIGVHFYDMLSFVFGRPKTNVVHHRAMDCAAGYLEYERARVRWFLSINGRDKTSGEGFAQRSMSIEDVGFYDFSKGFEDLHTQSYREIIAGRGFTLDEARPAIETVAHIRKAPIEVGGSNQHPMLAAVLADKGRYRDGYPV